MRILLVWIVAVVFCVSLTQRARADEQQKIPLRVLYLAREGEDQRTNAFTEFLTGHFAASRTVPREEFERSLLADADVVVLDWSQRERHVDKYPSPLGPLEEWDKPLVLLGSAGLLIAGPWQVIGGAG